MRTIKFRVWDEVHKMFHILGFVKEKEGTIFRGLPTITIPIEDIQKITQQFTGLLDKNKKEIFEGDVVKCVCKDRKHSFLDKIIWDKKDVCFRLSGDFDFYEVRMEVVGNIYENPELIKSKQGEKK